MDIDVQRTAQRDPTRSSREPGHACAGAAGHALDAAPLTFDERIVLTIPFDHPMVMGLVAPRALLVVDNRIDWLGIDSTFTAGAIAHAIWDGPGVPDGMGLLTARRP
ncbi:MULTISPECIES: glucuronyl esterase domain-containing protein [Sorangium]|uniref:4-O-methyl-glucuronoyl methylesterase-like domain-containing protein n=1 Tax=Sorangium cellulosum (strain So ce56) TaxID=448385 RepID=A9FSA2_SORC5|nr:hypothetical protein [Sorangium cellulosum]CAN95375.1 hypothetical protein predicted by Glimmer/Critica [Sorangium cellulosum So ce56]